MDKELEDSAKDQENLSENVQCDVLKKKLSKTDTGTAKFEDSTLSAKDTEIIDEVQEPDVLVNSELTAAGNSRDVATATNEKKSISNEKTKEPKGVMKESKAVPDSTDQTIAVPQPSIQRLRISEGMCIRTVPSAMGDISLYIKKSVYHEENGKMVDESITERIEGVLETIFPFEIHIEKLVYCSKALYQYARRFTWILAASSSILVLPPLALAEYEAVRAASETLTSQVLLGIE